MTTLQDIRSWAVSARPVFICGLERSGTSILQMSLSQHPSLFPVKDVYETFIFLKARSVLEDPTPTMTQAYLQGPANVQKFRQLCEQLRGQKADLSEADLIRAFFHFCAHTVYPGRQPLEKTPGHVRKLTRMIELFPNARVIVCTRDPVSIVASYRKRLIKEQSLGRSRDEWGWLDRTADQLCAHFEAVTSHILEARARWPNQIFVAPYDWLTDTPEAALKSICQFANLPFVADVLQPREVPGRKVDVLLSRPITRNESDDAAFVDEATAQLIRARTLPLMTVWQTAGVGEAHAV